jgi:ABC-type multidrug transport system fused ATPase/permease subunit
VPSSSAAFTFEVPAFGFGGQSASRLSFDFEARSGHNRASSLPGIGTPEASSFAQSWRLPGVGDERAPTSHSVPENPPSSDQESLGSARSSCSTQSATHFSPREEDALNPDRPLPTVERDIFSTPSRESTPSTAFYTATTSADVESSRETLDQDTDVQPIADLRNLRLTSPETPRHSSSQPETATPSINITPPAPTNEASLSQTTGADGLVRGVRALQIGSRQDGSPERALVRQSLSLTPSRRRRSGSGFNRNRYCIDNEEPPQTLFHTPEVQQALATGRALMSRMANVLSTSTLHEEDGSSIQSLYRQATRLNEFELPSNRVVGLVGDSGVGKSSLINSLLDKLELARAVSDRHPILLRVR